MYESVDKGISNTIMKTEGTTDLKLFTDTHGTTHTFHVLGENSELLYGAILGKDFFEMKENVINYCSHQIIMNDEVVVNFDPKPSANKTEPCRLTLKARRENIVEVLTSSKGLCLLRKSTTAGRIPRLFLDKGSKRCLRH